MSKVYNKPSVMVLQYVVSIKPERVYGNNYEEVCCRHPGCHNTKIEACMVFVCTKDIVGGNIDVLPFCRRHHRVLYKKYAPKASIQRRKEMKLVCRTSTV